jgi:hypothetical protein
LIDKLHQTVDYCLSYDLDVNGKMIPKDPVAFNRDRYLAAKDGKISILHDGGRGYAERWKNAWEQAEAMKNQQ